MYCGGGHLGFLIGIKNRYFVEDLPMENVQMPSSQKLQI
jgi:hypothetical protein